MPDGTRVDDSRRGEAEEHRLGVLRHGFDPEQHDSEADQDSGEVRPRGAEGPEEGLPEQQIDHMQRRIPGGVLPAEVTRIQKVDHFPGRWMVLLWSQELQEQVAQVEASDDVDTMAWDTRRWASFRFQNCARWANIFLFFVLVCRRSTRSTEFCWSFDATLAVRDGIFYPVWNGFTIEYGSNLVYYHVEESSLVHDLYLEFQNLWFSERGKTWNRKQIPHLDFSN